MDRVFISEPARNLDPDGLFATAQSPFEMDSALYFPARFMSLGVCQRSRDALVQLSLAAESMLGNNIGTFIRMTPEGARALAAHLIAEAQKVDNHVAAQAAAAIEAARQKGGA